MLDLLVIGAGPHALTLLCRLLEQDPDRSIDSRYREVRPKASLESEWARKARDPALRKETAEWLRTHVQVVDDRGQWLSRWREQFTGLHIPHLRSSLSVHPDPTSSYALEAYAEQTRRAHDVVEMKVMQRSVDFAGPFSLPGSELFEAFSEDLVKRYCLDDVVRRGKVVSLVPVLDPVTNRFSHCVATLDDGSELHARRVVCAIGGTNMPRVPDWATGLTPSTLPIPPTTLPPPSITLPPSITTQHQPHSVQPASPTARPPLPSGHSTPLTDLPQICITATAAACCDACGASCNTSSKSASVTSSRSDTSCDCSADASAYSNSDDECTDTPTVGTCHEATATSHENACLSQVMKTPTSTDEIASCGETPASQRTAALCIPSTTRTSAQAQLAEGVLPTGLMLHAWEVAQAFDAMAKRQQKATGSLSESCGLVSSRRGGGVDTSCNRNLLSGSRVVVVGGGLTSAQLALLAVQHGCTDVVMIMRSKLKIKQFDADLEFMGRNRAALLRHFDRLDGGGAQRLAALKAAIGGGSITPEAALTLARQLECGTVRMVQQEEVLGAEPLTIGWTLTLAHTGTELSSDDLVQATDCSAGLCSHDACPHNADCGATAVARGAFSHKREGYCLPSGELRAHHVWIATGSVVDVQQEPLFSGMLQAHPGLEVYNGLPLLSSDLRLHPEWDVFVVGAFSALSLGPGAVNIAGAKTASVIVVDALRRAGGSSTSAILSNVRVPPRAGQEYRTHAGRNGQNGKENSKAKTIKGADSGVAGGKSDVELVMQTLVEDAPTGVADAVEGSCKGVGWLAELEAALHASTGKGRGRGRCQASSACLSRLTGPSATGSAPAGWRAGYAQQWCQAQSQP